ncbi:MAG: hypothetical protein HKO62_13620 [Gammaproteobacteria bacterium]|nr:hypothetical protein [Gammaproteobacteria bacterium]
MQTLAYLTSSSYSGSTLVTFLLNRHPAIATIGEAEGWHYAPGEDYRCSCGEALTTCAFFQRVAANYREAGFSFDPREFGTRLAYVENRRLNTYLVDKLPGLGSSALERLRDGALRRLPGFAGRFRDSVRRNELMIRTALDYTGASVFVDGTKNPYRMRFLSALPGFELKPIYLVRDVRGVVASTVRKKGWPVAQAAQKWIADQQAILRLLAEQGPYYTLCYEALCADPAAELAALEAWLGCEAIPWDENYQAVEHHILGNEMRRQPAGPIRDDRRWQLELGAAQLDAVAATVRRFSDDNPDHVLAPIAARYLEA